MTAPGLSADVIVVGAGPAGAAAAAWCADAGLSVQVFDKARFPRDKICGDGLTPRAVAELHRLGVDTSGSSWHRLKGLRLIADDRQLELPWPEVSTTADHGLVRARFDFDHVLVGHARKYGAQVNEGMKVLGPLHDAAGTRIVGVRVQPVDERGRAAGHVQQWRAPVVVVADGVSARMAVAAGRPRLDSRPLGVAVRGYLPIPRHDDQWLESHLELWSGQPHHSTRLPGYGWIFPLGNGLANVGLGTVHSSPQRQSAAGVDFSATLEAWRATLNPVWGDGEFTDPPRSAALPMSLNRTPLYADGLLLVGDCAGMVSPFNGEGIAYALLAGRLAAHAIIRSALRQGATARDELLGQYASSVQQELGGYYALGRVFVRIIENPEIMRLCLRVGIRSEALMRVVVKLLADSYEPRGGQISDRVISALSRAAARS